MLDLRVGDRVQLRSGGPWMTVRHEIQGARVDVNWFGPGEVLYNTFSPAELRLHWFDAFGRWLTGARSPNADVLVLSPKTPWIGERGQFRANERVRG